MGRHSWHVAQPLPVFKRLMALQVPCFFSALPTERQGEASRTKTSSDRGRLCKTAGVVATFGGRKRHEVRNHGGIIWHELFCRFVCTHH